YLELLRVEVTAFHRNLIRSSLWPCSSPRGGRPLAVTLLYGVRTFLPPPAIAGGQRLSGLLSTALYLMRDARSWPSSGKPAEIRFAALEKSGKRFLRFGGAQHAAELLQFVRHACVKRFQIPFQ